MDSKLSKLLSPFSTLVVAYLGSIIAFFLPATKIIVGGQSYWQYLLNGYPGLIAFSILLLSMLSQFLFFYVKKKITGWQGLIAGAMTTWFSIKVLIGTFMPVKPASTGNLATHLDYNYQPMIGLILLLLFSVLLLASSIYNILTNK